MFLELRYWGDRVTTEQIFTGTGTALDERTERARKAVQVFRAMQPGLTGFARALTGNKTMVVELAAGTPRTDGMKIYYRPPIELGDLRRHTRRLCDKRDEHKQLLCDACRIREEVLVIIYHEIAHLAYGSFDTVTDWHKSRILEQAVKEYGTKYSKRLKARIENAPNEVYTSYIGIANLISPFLPMILNALEDARVNASMFKARRGTKVMFDAFATHLFAEGVEQEDHTFMRWAEYPLNAQAMISTFIMASNLNYQQGWLSDKVEQEVIADQQLKELTYQVSTARSVEAVYELSFPVLARLRELGYCLMPEDPDQEEPTDEKDSSEDESSDSDPSGADDASAEESSEEESEGGLDEDASSGGSDSEDPSGDDNGSRNGDSDTNNGEEEEREDDGNGSGEAAGDASPETDEHSGAVSPEPECEADSKAHERGDAGDIDSSSSGAEKSSQRDQRRSEEEPTETETEPFSKDNSSSEELVDTGADEGRGGITSKDDYYYGGPEEIEGIVEIFGAHNHNHSPIEEDSNDPLGDEQALNVAVVQGEYFEKHSTNVLRVNIFRHKDGLEEADAWFGNVGYREQYMRALGIEGDTETPEGVLGPALLESRRVFTDNAAATFEQNLKIGRINRRALGSRAWRDDDRLFQKKRLPGKRDYAVLLGVDISGSTMGANLLLAKRAARAQAELCARLGVDFEIYAHTASPRKGSTYGSGLYLNIYEVKTFDEPWDDERINRLTSLSSSSENLDGHSLEFYRKRMDRHSATDKIILYYTDGKMPAANYHEELEVLQREIHTCQQKRYTLLGVGIRTDSPVRHGLDTVVMNDDSNLIDVIRHLERRLIRRR